MATSFDATARINLDISSFAQGAAAITRSGGQMEKVFQNLNQVLGRVAFVESDLAAKLRTTLQVYNQATAAVKSYATAVVALQKGEQQGANGARLMTQAFQQLRSSLAQVQGMSEKEHQRLARTIALYERMANVIKQLAAAQKQMSSVTQNAIAAQQKEEQAKRKAEETARRLALEEEKLAQRREALRQSAIRIAQEEERIALARRRASQATSDLAGGQVSLSKSTYALRSSLGELESTYEQIYRVAAKIPTAMASAAISHEQAFAQVARVVGDADAASAGLLLRFQEIAQQAPISFQEVSSIGRLGAAIGVAASSLGDFTDTIVKFSLTTGVASEEATLLLGRIAQMQDVPISAMEQLGSAILALGTASAATEQEILRVNASIATVANLFGLTAQETAGLSAALATLQVRPELARGSLTRVFNELTNAVSSGGTELEKLSKVMGMTSDEVVKLFKLNPGAFFLAFVDGLSRAAGAGGEVQGVLRELGINAVRDIDTFSRLANNADIVREAFGKANLEFARGTELQKQSQGIYNTTAAELQNMRDAFETLLATMGGRVATMVGDAASKIADAIEWIVKAGGDLVPVFGTALTLTTALGAGWLLYKVALAKTVQSLIAYRELQRNLNVTTFNLKVALDAYRGTLGGTAASQTVMNTSMRTLSASVQSLSATLAASQAGIRSYAAAAASSAAGLGAMSAASVAASRSLNGTAAASGATASQLRALNATGAASALAMTNVSKANHALALTQTQLNNASRAHAQQMVIATGAMQGMNRAAVPTATAVGSMSTSMQRAVTAGVQFGAGMNVAGASASKAATAFTSTAAAAERAGLAARLASFAMGPLGIAAGTAAIAFYPLIKGMFDTSTAADKMVKAAMDATGGTQALANAIKADTDAAIRAAGSMQKYNEIVRSGSRDALRSIGAYRAVSLAKSDMATSDQRAAEAAKRKAEEENRAIEITRGSIEELRRQAKGHGAGAEAAARYVRQIEKNKEIIAETSRAIAENTVVLGENTRQWLMDTTQALVQQSKLADGSKLSKMALQQLGETGLSVGKVLRTSLDDPQVALKELDRALKEVTVTSRQYAPPGSENTEFGRRLNNEAAAAIRLRDFLEGLRKVIASEADETTKSALAKDLLKDALDDTGGAAQSASGKIKLTKESLEELETDAEAAQNAISELGQAFERFGTPLDAFKKAAENSFAGAKDALDKFSLSSKGGLEAYLRELEKIAKAQRDWSKNLIKISATLGPDIAEQFRKLGPEAAPAVKQLADLSASELAKLGPRLREIGTNATSELAAAIVQNSGKVKNATLEARTVIAEVFGNVVDKAKTSQDFAEISNQYAKLVSQLGKLKGVTIDIKANDAQAFRSLKDLSLYIDLVGRKKIKPEVLIEIFKARDDLARLQRLIADAKASGSLDAKGKAELDAILFKAQLSQLTTYVGTLEAEGKLDAKGKGKLTDEEYRAKVLELTKFLASAAGQGLLDPKGKAQLNDKQFRAQMQTLANLILGEEAAGKFDVNGDGKLDDKEFKRLLEALKRAVADANRGKLDPKGRVTLANVSGFQQQLNGVVQAAWRAGNQISQAMNRSVTVRVGYYYYQKNSPPSGGGGVYNTAVAARSGGWISGPGGPKSDSIPAWVSNGEFVVNAAAAKRFGALLEVINRAGGRGFAAVAKHLVNATLTGGNKQIRVMQGGAGTTMLGSSALLSRIPPQSVSAFAARMAMPQSGPTNVWNIYNQYPQAEPTSVTINRSLAYAATISGV